MFRHTVFRRAIAATALTLLTLSQATAEGVTCTPEHAVYRDEGTDFTLTFRPPASWETSGNTVAVFEAAVFDGRELWGTITSNQGTSRDTGRAYFGCPSPGPDDVPDDATLEECLVWEGVVYALQDGQIAPWPEPGSAAPPSVILTDLGRQLRYNLMENPGEEPWDQLHLTGCKAG